MTAELCIIVPTFNEKDNIGQLYAALGRALEGVDWEVIFVDDDSPDSTSDLIRRIALEDSRVRCVQRINRRGLSSACVEGMMATAAPYIAVMDADLQHDDRVLPVMLDLLKNSDKEIIELPADPESVSRISSMKVNLERINGALSNTFRNIRLLVEAAGGTTDDIAKMSVSIRDDETRKYVNDAWLDMFPNEDDRPARHTQSVNINPRYHVQIEFTAVLDGA